MAVSRCVRLAATVTLISQCDDCVVQTDECSSGSCADTLELPLFATLAQRALVGLLDSAWR